MMSRVEGRVSGNLGFWSGLVLVYNFDLRQPNSLIVLLNGCSMSGVSLAVQ